MKIDQIYTGCLAEAAYYIESNGEAVIIDPLRDIEEYLDKAKADNAKIKYIFLSHFHADFMAGHQDLAKATGATIVVGPTEAPIGYEAHIGTDNELFKVGDITLKLLHTPGHTTESICLLLIDENGKEKCLFSGDTLFIGDVGRPDLAQKVVADLTQDKLARMMFHSLRNKIMPLADDIIVYPNHGAGSPCGKNMSSETFDTLGNQKKTNYCLRPDQTEDEFVAELLDGLKEPPAYFPSMVIGNIKGTESIDIVRERAGKALSPKAFSGAHTEDVILLDVRSAKEFVDGFVPGSFNIDLDSSFAIWAGTILRDVNAKILLVTPVGREAETIDRLARVGFDGVIGYLEGGFEAWKAAGNDVDNMPTVTAKDLADKADANIIDVRRESEFFSERIKTAENMPLNNYWDHYSKIDKDKTYYVHCRSGNRSAIFASIMRSKGFDNLINVASSFDELKELGTFEVTDYVCPSTML